MLSFDWDDPDSFVTDWESNGLTAEYIGENLYNYTNIPDEVIADIGGILLSCDNYICDLDKLCDISDITCTNTGSSGNTNGSSDAGIITNTLLHFVIVVFGVFCVFFF